ncbi:hypothetical protein [Caenimonas soli]|uniref:hypothetical protein n=1 Tax=Caenimonas soli TaxID=2735555 RepID=UPI00155324EC|nr:hypothetical protein [Caenimonas soli]NPC57305.1 hypothetical protein [Caenimonas soli]
METARVYVWRIRLCLLALALALVGVDKGVDKPTPVSESTQLSQSSPTVEPVAVSSANAGPVRVGTAAFPRSAAQPLKPARSKIMAPRPLDLRCSGRGAKPSSPLIAGKSTRAQKSSGCRLTTGGSTNIKTPIPGQRKPFISAAKKRDISMAPTRNAESPKSRHKVARKGDGKPADNVAALRQARTRSNA